MLAVSGALVRYSNGADVTVTVALRGAAVGILVDRLIRVQWLVSTLGGECLAASWLVADVVWGVGSWGYNFGELRFGEVRILGFLGSSPQASSPFKWDKGDNAAFQFTRVSKPTQSPRRAATRRSPSQRS